MQKRTASQVSRAAAGQRPVPTRAPTWSPTATASATPMIKGGATFQRVMSFRDLLGPLICSNRFRPIAPHTGSASKQSWASRETGERRGRPMQGTRMRAAPPPRSPVAVLPVARARAAARPPSSAWSPSSFCGGGDGCLWGSEVLTSPDVSPSGLAEQYVRQERWRRWDEALAGRWRPRGSAWCPRASSPTTS